MQTLLVSNPAAGDGSRGTAFWARELDQAGIQIDEQVDITSDHWHATLTTHDRVLVAGGDGSLSALTAVCLSAGCVLGILPSGTANDFARALGIPEDPVAVCQVLVQGDVQSVDVGRIGTRWFLNVAHIGLGAEVAHSVRSEHKRFWGRFSYLRTLAERISASRGFRAQIECDGQRIEGRWLAVAVANGPSFGGGHQIPGASLHDGFLHVVGIRPASMLWLFLAWLAAHFLGRPRVDDALETWRCRECRVVTRKPCHVTVDGEAVGSSPVEFEIRPAALRVVAPPQ